MGGIAHPAANESALRTNLLSLQTTQTRHVGSDPNVERYDPGLWTDEFALLNQLGQVEIQSDPSTTTAPTSKTILGGKLGCVRSSRAC
ncbi:MAG TPA: hypothetical protein VNX88_16845 [Terriglobales bacterium]|nr:hypothetical protein [Terriglobales bacterium]